MWGNINPPFSIYNYLCSCWAIHFMPTLVQLQKLLSTLMMKINLCGGNINLQLSSHKSFHFNTWTVAKTLEHTHYRKISMWSNISPSSHTNKLFHFITCTYSSRISLTHIIERYLCGAILISLSPLINHFILTLVQLQNLFNTHHSRISMSPIIKSTFLLSSTVVENL